MEYRVEIKRRRIVVEGVKRESISVVKAEISGIVCFGVAGSF